VPSAILQPRDTCADKAAYDATAKKLAGLFIENFRKYQSSAGAQVKGASPVV
jgi:phosphoenolpyruvate carboxykinase (ATP)